MRTVHSQSACKLTTVEASGTTEGVAGTSVLLLAVVVEVVGVELVVVPAGEDGLLLGSSCCGVLLRVMASAAGSSTAVLLEVLVVMQRDSRNSIMHRPYHNTRKQACKQRAQGSRKSISQWLVACRDSA